MKQILQNMANGKTRVADVPAPLVGPGQVLVRVAASAISSGTERSVAEFAARSLFEKARSRPDLVRQVMDKAKREGWLSAIQAARSRLDEETSLGYSNAGVVLDVGTGSGAQDAMREQSPSNRPGAEQLSCNVRRLALRFARLLRSL